MPRTLSLLAVLKKVDAKGVKSLSNAQWDTFLASDTEPNEIQDKIKKLEGYEEKFAAYDATGELIVEDNQAMIDRFKKKTGRAKGRESFKVKKTKINVGEFLGKDRTPDKSPDKSQNPDISGIFDDDEEKKGDVGPKGMESKVGRLARILRDTRGRVLKLEEEKKKGPSKKLVTDGLDETVNVIAEKVASIEGTLKEQIEVDKENAKLQKQQLENEKRDSEESRLGKVTGFLKGAADKIIKPVSNIFSQIFGFIKKLILGKILLNILKWFGNPANAGKIQSIVKFLGQNWKKLLSLYLVFGTGLGRFVRWLTKTAIKGAIKLITLGAKLLAAKKVKGARGVAKFFGGKKGAILGSALAIGGSVAMYSGVNNMLGGGEEEEPQKFNKGGKVRGQGDKDTVPAMLTPGEFVMSKGAVQQYGIDTMESMNAAAGGTNVPVLMPNKKRKGFAGGGGPGSDALDLGSYMIQRTEDGGVHTRSTTGGLIGGGFDKTTTSTYKRNFTDKDGNEVTVEEKDRMKEQITSIGVPDLIEHQDQLLSAIHKLKGFESVTIDQVINGKTGIPQEKLLPILIRSDAQKATSDKQRKARKEDMKARGIKSGGGHNISMYDEVGKSLAGTIGYRMGQTNPDQLISSSTTYDSSSKQSVKTPESNPLSDLSESINVSSKDDGTRKFNKGGLVPNLIANFNGGGLVQYLNNGGRVLSTRENATIQEGQVVSGNMNLSEAQKLKREIELEEEEENAMFDYGINSPEHNAVIKKRLILSGTPPEAIYTAKDGSVKIKGYDTSGGKTTFSGEKRRSISNKSQKNPANFSQPQGSGGGFGLKRMIGGMADMATGHMFDFDNRSGGGLLRKTANAIGGLFGKGDKVMGKEPKIKEIKIPAEGLESILIKIASKQDIKTPVGQPSLSGPKITVIPEKKSVNAPMGGGGGGGKAIPKFNAGHGSIRKAKQLGIAR